MRKLLKIEDYQIPLSFFHSVDFNWCVKTILVTAMLVSVAFVIFEINPQAWDKNLNTFENELSMSSFDSL